MSIRGDQIVVATLELLAETPVDRVTTRQIARRLGLTQPALFRHFASRDAILEAAVRWTRVELEGLAQSAVSGSPAPLDIAVRLGLALGAHAQRWPGLPRLLFADVVNGDTVGRERGQPGSSWGLALRSLAAGQRAVIAGLVDEAVRRGDAPASVDPGRAGALFVAGLQGVLLQWLLDWGGSAGRVGQPDVSGFLTVWRAGVDAGLPRAEPARPGAASDAAVSEQPTAREIHIDAGALLRAGTDPLQDILAAAARLAPGGHLHVTAPFLPSPLMALLQSRGWTVDVRPDGAASPSSEGGYHIAARRPA